MGLWQKNEKGKWSSDRVRLCKYTLWNLEQALNNKHEEGDKKEYRLTPEEESLQLAVVLLIQSYERKDMYNKRKDEIRNCKEESRQLAEQLQKVTEERDSLLEKVTEAQVQSGLFIKFVRDKLKI